LAHQTYAARLPTARAAGVQDLAIRGFALARLVVLETNATRYFDGSVAAA
jgi:hypothetical protein